MILHDCCRLSDIKSSVKQPTNRIKFDERAEFSRSGVAMVLRKIFRKQLFMCSGEPVAERAQLPFKTVFCVHLPRGEKHIFAVMDFTWPEELL